MTTNTIFETGATSAASNNLVLSVLNDGQAYKDRKHAGFAMLAGSSHRLSFRDLANNEAKKQRLQFGSKFKPAEISEAAMLIQSTTLEQCLEQIRDEWNGEPITITHRKWWDATNGNTYWSAIISIPTLSGHHLLSVPFQYGYGDQWQHDCRAILEKIGFENMTQGYSNEKPLIFEEQGWMKKNQMFTGIHV